MSALSRLLRPLPGGPGLALDPVDLLEFQVAGLVEVADRRGPPFFADVNQVLGNRRLRDAEFARDLHLGPTLDVQVGHFLAAIDKAQLLTSLD